MAINSNLSSFTRLDENFFLANSRYNVDSDGICDDHSHINCNHQADSTYTTLGVYLKITEAIPFYGAFVSDASYFNQTQLQPKFKKHFHDFINSRLEYLENLKTIGDGWISGKSLQPTTDSIEFSKNLLKKIRTWYTSEKCTMLSPPKIIMSPTPSGGISLEIYFNTELSFTISILNDSISLDKEQAGYFVEIDATKETVFDEIINGYSNYELIR